MAEEGFLRRWARLKAQPEEAVPVVAQPLPAAPIAVLPTAPVAAPAEALPPPPTIADAAALTADSDFSLFVAKNVDAAVRRLAMKKLFADPHFHGHDGLDIYMGDYTVPSPVSAEMLEQMSHHKNIFARLDDAIERVEDLLGTDGAAQADTAGPVPADDAAQPSEAALLTPPQGAAPAIAHQAIAIDTALPRAHDGALHPISPAAPAPAAAPLDQDMHEFK